MKHNSPKKKKCIVFAIAIVLAALALLAVLALVLEKLVPSSTPDTDYSFYEPDYEADIFEDEDYLALDRCISYTDEMGQTIRIADGNYTAYGIGPSFFSLYFYALENGDADTFNSLFTDEYYKTNDKIGRFTMQKIYNIELKYISKDTLDNDRYSMTFSLDYYIYRNDGTFRRDIGSGMTRTQYITLYYTSDDAHINIVKTEYRK